MRSMQCNVEFGYQLNIYTSFGEEKKTFASTGKRTSTFRSYDI
jgi:hypothetical protein